MKRSRVLILATASSLAILASVGGVASATNAKLATQSARTTLSALSAGGGEDDGGSLGKVVHGTIGSALPSPNAAGKLRSLGGGDGELRLR